MIFFSNGDFTSDHFIFFYNGVFGMYSMAKDSHFKSSMMLFARLQQITLDLDDLEHRCTNRWTNLPHVQKSYLFKLLTGFWKLYLLYIDSLHIFFMSLMFHLEFFFLKTCKQKYCKTPLPLI
jgi:hypothetical protein